MSHSHDLPPELLDAARALEQHRPQLTEPQLARVKRRVTGEVPTMTTRPAGGFMKSRLAITAILATGVLMSGGGAALGVSALTTVLTASSAQYGNQGAGTGNNAGANAGNGANPGAGAQGADANGVLGAGAQGAGANGANGANGASGPGRNAGDVADARETTAAAQAPRQLSASQADRLPFTGYAAIPLLLIGLALLVAGLMLRRSTSGATLGV